MYCGKALLERKLEQKQHLDSLWPEWNRNISGNTSFILIISNAAVKKVYC